MNFIKVISLIFVISYIYSAYEDCTNSEIKYKLNGLEQETNNTFVASSADDCKGRKILEYNVNYYYTQNDDDKIKTYKTHCCYYTYEGMEDDTKKISPNINSNGDKVGYAGSCIELTDSQYDNIQNYINYLQFRYDRNGAKIDCNSYYLHLGLLTLLLLIIF